MKEELPMPKIGKAINDAWMFYTLQGDRMSRKSRISVLKYKNWIKLGAAGAIGLGVAVGITGLFLSTAPTITMIGAGAIATVGGISTGAAMHSLTKKKPEEDTTSAPFDPDLG